MKIQVLFRALAFFGMMPWMAFFSSATRYNLMLK